MRLKHAIFILLLTLAPLGAESLSILVIFNKYPHMYRTFFDNQIKGLYMEGHNVTLLSLDPSDVSLPSNLDFFDLEKQLYYSFLPQTKRSFDIVYVPCSTIALRALRSIRRFEIKSRIVVGYHGPVWNTFASEPIACYLPCSNYCAGELISKGVPQKNIHVHHCGVNLERFTFKNEDEKIPHDPLKIITVARLVDYKGHRHSILAVAELLRHLPCEYTIIGDGPMDTTLKMLVDQLGLQDHVRLVGYKSPEEVSELLRASDLFLHPSFHYNGHQEGIPTAIMEAMAVGLPVVSTWHTGIPELVVNRESGYLVEEHDVDALVGRLTFLADHPEVWGLMGLKGRRIVEADFNEVTQSKKMSLLFKKIVNEFPRRRPLPFEKKG